MCCNQTVEPRHVESSHSTVKSLVRILSVVTLLLVGAVAIGFLLVRQPGARGRIYQNVIALSDLDPRPRSSSARTTTWAQTFALRGRLQCACN